MAAHGPQGQTIYVAPPSATASDNVTAINNAITQANAIGSVAINSLAGGCTVQLAPGTYVIDSPVLHKSNVTLRGHGSSGTVIERKANTDTVLWQYADDASSNGGFANQWWVEELRFDGNRANQTTDQYAVMVRRGSDITKSPAYITASPVLMGGDFFGFRNVVISNVHGTGFYAAGLGPVSQMHIIGMFIWDCSMHGMDFQGVDCDITNLQIGSAGRNCIANVGANNRFSNVKLYGAGKELYSGNPESDYFALNMEGGALWPQFTNLEIQECYGPGIWCAASYARVSGAIQGCRGVALRLNGGTLNEFDLTVGSFNANAPTSAFYVAPGCLDNKVTITGKNWSGPAIRADADAAALNRTKLSLFTTSGESVVAVAAATTTTLPPGEVVSVTGNTNITSITAGLSGRRVTLVFSGTPTVSDGSNLKLSADFVATADDTLSLVCDGTNWIETARSAN